MKMKSSSAFKENVNISTKVRPTSSPCEFVSPLGMYM